MPKISVITPTVRPEFLTILAKCLNRQIVDELFEWIIISPKSYLDRIILSIDNKLYTEFEWHYVEEPNKKEGDYYGLNKAWNEGFKKAKGELIVSIVDGLWFEPDLLEKLWAHYEANPKACISGVGNQYDQIINNKPEHMVWQDPRIRMDQGSFYQVTEREMELCVASIPKQAVYDVGGIDADIYDKYCALSEKELCARIYKAGYTLWLDQNVVYRAIKHPRIGGKEEWDKHYFAGWPIHEKHLKEIENGTRLKLHYL